MDNDNNAPSPAAADGRCRDGGSIAACPGTLLAVEAADDALMPSIGAGETVLVDPRTRRLEHGAIIAVRAAHGTRLWLYQEGFLGLGSRRREGCDDAGGTTATLSGLAGAFRLRAPVIAERLPLAGTVVARLGDPAGTDDADPLGRYIAERARLLGALAEAGTARGREDGAASAMATLLRRIGERAGIAAMEKLFAEAMAEADFAQHFMVEQRVEALNARLFWLENAVADQEARSLGGIRAKLDMLWHQQYEAFPDHQDDLGARVIRSALASLARLETEARRPPP